MLGVDRRRVRTGVRREGLEALTLPPRRPGTSPTPRHRRPPGPPRDVVLRVPEDEGFRVVRNVAIDMPVVSVNAMKEHWAERMRRRAKVHRVIREAFGLGWKPPVLPVGWKWLVTITRFGRLKLDQDNCLSAMKAHIDAVADLLGLKDNDPRIEFRAAQVQRSVPAQVRRFNRQSRTYEMRPGFKSWFRVRIEQVRVEAAPLRWALVERVELGESEL